MNYAEMVSLTRTLVGDSRFDDLTGQYLGLAKDAVLSRVYPFGGEWDEVPARYHTRTCEIACYLINRRGAEGEVSHSESGVERTYGSAYIPDDMFVGILPFVDIPRSTQ